jgi:ABC-type transporter Mla subunit MlaD
LFAGGKYVKMALDAEKLVQMGMQKGLKFVGEKTRMCAEQVDIVIDKVELVQNVTRAFADADDFVNQTLDLIQSKVKPVIEMAAGPDSPLSAILDGMQTFQTTINDVRARADPLIDMLESAATVIAAVDDFMENGDVANITTRAVNELVEHLPALMENLNSASELQEGALKVRELTASFESNWTS